MIENKHVLKEIKKHNNLEVNIPAYATSMMNLNDAYSMVVLSFQYYTLSEMMEEQMTEDPACEKIICEIHSLIKQGIVDGPKSGADQEKLISRVDKLRNEIINRMEILTAFVDRFQIEEYIINRLEYGVMGTIEDVDASELSAKIFQYIFNSKDNMVINSKVQMVTAQLPVRMTKGRFYDVLSDSISIYNGAQQSSLNDFVDLILTTAGLSKPEHFDDAFPVLTESLAKLSALSYKDITKEQFMDAKKKLDEKAAFLNGIVSVYMQMQETVNHLYAVLLCQGYMNSDADDLDKAARLMGIIYDSCFGGAKLEDMEEANMLLMGLEGRQEAIYAELSLFESELYNILSDHEELIDSLMQKVIFKRLQMLEKLHANSLFVSLNEEDDKDTLLVDLSYMAEIKQKLMDVFNDAFAGCKKERKRAIMGAVLGQVPVIFQSQKEISEYINYALCGCSNESELTACKYIFEDMMME